MQIYLEVFDIKKLYLPNCPYCEAEVGYFDAFLSKNRQSHKCANCGRRSAVKIRSSIYRLFVLVLITVTIAFIFTIFMGGQFCLMGLALILVATTIFYVFTPFSVELAKLQCGPPSQSRENSTGYNKTQKDSSNEIYSN